MTKEKLLIVDDDRENREMLVELFANYETVQAADGNEALQKLAEYNFKVILLDIMMKRMNGIAALNEIKKRSPQSIVVMLTAYARDPKNFNECRLLADDIIDKDIDPDLLVFKVDKLFEKYDSFIAGDQKMFVTGSNHAMLSIQKEIETKIADSSASILLCGETGTGKEYIAKLIHDRSLRKNQPFIAVNCSTIDKGTVISALFGHSKGSFTDAKNDHQGYFEQANGGTILLDEITETDLSLQAKLLRVLQERKITRLGSVKEIILDIRIIASSNKNLEEAVKNGQFREDLYYRLNVISIHLPALRQRKEDLVYFINYFIKKFNAINRRKVYTISKDAMDLLISYDFPGNIRQLAAVIESAVILAESETILLKDIRLNQFDKADHSEKLVVENYLNRNWQSVLDDISLLYFQRILETCEGNITKAAKKAGVTRKTFYEHLNKLS